MAFTFKQAVGNTSATTTVTQTATFTAGSLVIAIATANNDNFFANQPGDGSSGVLFDSQGNLWQCGVGNVKTTSSNIGVIRMTMWYCNSIQGGSVTVTASNLNATEMSLQLREYSGQDLTSCYGTVAVGTGNTSPMSISSLTVEYNNSLVVAAGMFDVTSVPAAGTGYANVLVTPSNGDTTTHIPVASSDDISQAAGTISITPLTNPGTANYVCVALVFRAVGAPTGIQPVQTVPYSIGLATTTGTKLKLKGVKLGNLLVLCLRAVTATSNILSVKDQNGNSFKPTASSPQFDGSNTSYAFYYLVAPANYDVTTTVTFAVSNMNVQATLTEVTGATNTWAFDNDSIIASGTSGSNGVVNAPTVNPSDNDIVFSISTSSTDYSYCTYPCVQIGSMVAANGASFALVGSGSFTANFTDFGFGGWSTMAAAFRGNDILMFDLAPGTAVNWKYLR